DDHQSRRVLVEPMDDAGARQRGARGVAGEQRIEQRSRPVARRRMDDHAGGLVDHQHVVVLVDDRNRQGLWAVGAAFFSRLQGDVDALAGANALRGTAGSAAVDLDPSALDQLLQVVARELRNERDDDLVEPFSVQDRIDGPLAPLDGRIALVAVDVAGGGDAIGLRADFIDHIRFRPRPKRHGFARSQPTFPSRMRKKNSSWRSWIAVSAISTTTLFLSACDTTPKDE